MGRIIEGYWDCSQCGKTMIRGGVHICPDCGKARDDTTRFYMKGPKKYVDTVKAKKINKNPDWVCNYCQQLNSDDNKTCEYCGAPREDTKNYFQNKEYQEKEKLEKEIINEKVSISNNLVDSEKRSTVKSDKIFKSDLSILLVLVKFFGVLGITFLVIFLISGMVSFFTPKDEELTISNLSWERTIEVDRLKTFFENDWNLPNNARLKYTNEEISGYDHVLDHYETKTRTVAKKVFSHYEEEVVGYKDLGNGYFEEITENVPIYNTELVEEQYQEPVYKDVPIYDTMYYYEIDRYVHNRYEKSSGENTEPYWPEVVLANNEKISSKREFYYVTGINSDGKEKKISLSYDDWNELEIDKTVKFEVYFDGSGKVINE